MYEILSTVKTLSKPAKTTIIFTFTLRHVYVFVFVHRLIEIYVSKYQEMHNTIWNLASLASCDEIKLLHFLQIKTIELDSILIVLTFLALLYTSDGRTLIQEMKLTNIQLQRLVT